MWTNLAGNLQGTLAAANNKGAIYPPGSVVQMVPTVMVGRDSGFNLATGDWEFLFERQQPGQHHWQARGFAGSKQPLWQNCFGCLRPAREPDFRLRKQPRCEPIPIDHQMTGAPQRPTRAAANHTTAKWRHLGPVEAGASRSPSAPPSTGSKVALTHPLPPRLPTRSPRALIESTDMTQKLDKVVYRAHATSTGGRDGTSSTPDGALNLKLAVPKEMGGNGQGVNPEQLFAAGYSACFIGAMKFVARHAEDRPARRHQD